MSIFTAQLWPWEYLVIVGPSQGSQPLEPMISQECLVIVGPSQGGQPPEPRIPWESLVIVQGPRPNVNVNYYYISEV